MYELLIAAKVDIEANAEEATSCLIIAAACHRTECMSLLLASKANIYDEDAEGGYSALITAAATGHIEGVQMLIALGADIDATDNEGLNPLMWAAQQQRVECVQMLIDAMIARQRKRKRLSSRSDTSLEKKMRVECNAYVGKNCMTPRMIMIIIMMMLLLMMMMKGRFTR